MFKTIAITGFLTGGVGNAHRQGFTLAEVLITLGIIGVVAAMTLPALINQTHGKELETGLKKAYTVLQAAYNKMTYDEGQIVNNTNYPAHTFMPKFKTYFKISKDCNFESCESDFTDEEGTNRVSQNYKTYNNKKMRNSLLDDGQVFVSDGMFIMVENMTGGKLLLISIDVNGYNKKPNRWGHDLFTFQITDNGKLLPMGAKGTSYDSVNNCSSTSTSTTNGIGCTYKALTDKNYFRNLPK